MLDIYVLGARDPEMDEMERVLKKRELSYLYAKVNGVRVNPGNAYKADNRNEIPLNTRTVFIECEMQEIGRNVVIDHHRPNDPGYGKPPELFLEASSLGQLLNRLSIERNKEQEVLAAMDHCYCAAVQDKCPGVSGKEVLHKKMDEIMKSTIATLQRSPIVKIGKVDVFLLEENTGIGYTASYLMAQVAAVSLGIPLLIPSYDEKEGKEKLNLCGSVSEETVTCFMEQWAPKNGWGLDIYGNPARGYAGAYRLDPKKQVFCTWCEYDHFPPIHSEKCKRVSERNQAKSRYDHEQREKVWAENDARDKKQEWGNTPLRDRPFLK
jgi:hypothetical protein